MNIKEEKKGDGDQYRRVLVSLITNSDFLNWFSTKYSEDFFEAPFASKLAKLCLDYNKKFEQAPDSHMEDIYLDAVKNNVFTEGELDITENLLNTMSEEYVSGEEINVKYLKSLTEDLSKKQNVEGLIDNLKQALAEDNLAHAESLVTGFNAYQDLSEVSFTQPFVDENAVDKALEANKPPLFTVGGAFGELINPELYEASFVAIRANAGIGKTWTGAYLGIKAVMARRNTVIIQAGDMTENQYNKRLFTMISGIPAKPLKKGAKVPTLDCIKNQQDSCCLITRQRRGYSIIDGSNEVDPSSIKAGYEPCIRCQHKGLDFSPVITPLPHYEDREFTAENLKSAQKVFAKRLEGRTFHTLVVPSKSYNVRMIDKRLTQLHKEEGVIPEVVVIDYEGLLDKDDSTLVGRDIFSMRYSLLRALSQKWNICLIILEQSDAEGYDGGVQKMSNFTDSRTKNDEITGGIGLAQTDDDKKRGIIRGNKYKSREEEFCGSDEVIICNNLNCGMFNVASFWKKDMMTMVRNDVVVLDGNTGSKWNTNKEQE